MRGLIISAILLTISCQQKGQLNLYIGDDNKLILSVNKSYIESFQIDTSLYYKKVRSIFLQNERNSIHHHIYVGTIVNEWYPLEYLSSQHEHPFEILKEYTERYIYNLSELSIDQRFYSIGYSRKDLGEGNYQIESVYRNDFYYIGFTSIFFYNGSKEQRIEMHAKLLESVVLNPDLTN